MTRRNKDASLDVPSRKSTDKAKSHCILKKHPDLSGDDTLNNLARLLEEQDANVFGINVIWARSYDEMPGLLASIVGS